MMSGTRKEEEEEEEEERKGRDVVVPWLVMSGQQNRVARSFYRVVGRPQPEEKQVELPEAKGHYFWGSFHDWLIAVKPGEKRWDLDLHISLLNPFTGRRVPLPPVGEENGRPNQLVLSASPLDPSCCIYMLLGHTFLSLWIPEKTGEQSSSWIHFYLEKKDDTFGVGDDDYGPWACDAIFYQGCFYILGQDCNLRLLDAQHARALFHTNTNTPCSDFDTIRTQLVELQIIPHYPKVTKSREIARNLVESGGDILMVCRFFRAVPDDGGSENYEVKVYRLDLDGKAWVLVDDLGGDRILFVGTNCSKSYPVRDVVGGSPNCIYFTHGGSMFPPYTKEWDGRFDPCNYSSYASQSGDWSVFELGGGGGNHNNFSYISERDEPIWLTAAATAPL